eukprot:m.258903 g.258903  ORF g.258903 m.258903 type:complete len:109 (-) comp22028_c0_seq1:82-408(-)
MHYRKPHRSCAPRNAQRIPCCRRTITRARAMQFSRPGSSDLPGTSNWPSLRPSTIAPTLIASVAMPAALPKTPAPVADTGAVCADEFPKTGEMGLADMSDVLPYSIDE